MDNREKLNSLIDEACKAHGVTLVELDMFQAGKRKTIRLYIDKPEGVSIDDCTAVSHFLSDALDLDPEIIPGAFTLEVSSPGLDRPLKSVADFLRNKGRFIRVTRSTGKPITGKLVEADEDNLTLTLKGNAGNVTIPRSQVLVAKVDVQI
ncbi:MAG: ribosome maturation factor RimP [Fibrobacteraceae bacterium]|nr:ribosome maturation factor RimP [Fibrobacteraceae bacterium]